jgi:uncharacterized membrane protein YagU involved in acid resistance
MVVFPWVQAMVLLQQCSVAAMPVAFLALVLVLPPRQLQPALVRVAWHENLEIVGDKLWLSGPVVRYYNQISQQLQQMGYYF